MFKKLSKHIKKIYKTLLIVLLGVLLIPGILSLLLFLPSIQTPIAQKITEIVSRNLNTEISIGRVSFSPVSGIHLSDFLIYDRQNDTLLYTKSLRTGIEHVSFRKKQIIFGDMRIQEPFIKIREHEEAMNYAFLFDSIKPAGDLLKWNYAVNELIVDNGELLFEHTVLREKGFAADSLYFNNIELNVLQIQNDSITVEIHSLSMPKINGFGITNLSAVCKPGKKYMDIEQLIVHTGKSRLCVKHMIIPTDKNVPLEEKNLLVDIREIFIDPSDIRNIWHKFPDLKMPMNLSGFVQGSLNNLKGQNINFGYGNTSQFNADFDINDLLNFNETYIYADVKSLTTDIADIELFLSETEKKTVKLPGVLYQMGNISYKGNFTGFVNDMVTYGTIKTGLGNIITDVGLKLKDDNSLVFAGLVEADNFELGKMLGAEKNVGAVSFDLEIKGSHEATGKYFAYLNGYISALDFNEYRYNNIVLNGLLTNQKFDGNIIINDPNGKLDFNGKVDMSGEVPVFDFFAVIENAQLDRLNLVPKLKDGVLSVVIDTNFEGSSFDDIIGEINLQNGILYTPKTALNLDSLAVKAVRIDNEKRITIESDFIEGELTGQYYFRNIGQALNRFLHNYLPSYNIVTPNDTPERNNIFDFLIRFKEINSLATLLFPDMSISNKGFVKGSFNSIDHHITVEGELDHLHYKSIYAQELEMKLNSNDDGSLSFTARTGSADIGNFASLYNLSIHQNAQNDTIQSNVFWNNWGNTTYSGALYSTTDFKKDAEGKLSAKLNLHPSSVIIGDTVWNLYPSHIDFYTNGFCVSDFKIEHNNQFIALTGFADRETADSLKLTINRMKLSQFFENRNDKAISMSGIINGELTFKDVFRIPLLSGNAAIDQFVFNRAEMGTLSVKSVWNRELSALTMTAQLDNNNQQSLYGFGLFHPKEQNLNFMFDADSLSIAFLNPFIESALQNVTGNATGKLYLKGQLAKPVLTGSVKLNNGGFFVDILNTSYSLTDSVFFYPDEINFRDMTIRDINGKSGKFGGSIYHSGFKDLEFKLRLNANDMLLMNTRFKDNPLYYGTLYGDGTMSITGTPNNTNIAINGRTRHGSRFFIPIQNSKTASENSFINFVAAKNSDDSKGNKKNYSVNVSGAKIDLDIAITPDAEIQIIFDEQTGDLLRSVGTGNVQIRIDRTGNILFFGDYEIESGDYHFSLEHILDKTFILNKGGTVRFQGDPYNALIDITAIYKLRASLSDLSMSFGTEERNTGRVAINCKLMLSDRLQQPAIKFDIETPSLDKSRETLIRDMITTEEEMNRQVLSLLLLNRFYSPEERYTEGDAAQNERNRSLITTSEVLSAQISRWASTISEDFDVGVVYRPGDDYLTSDEFELALSTQLLNDRITLSTNVGYEQYYQGASKMMGDFDLDIKLNSSGTVRVKAYSHTNDQLYYTTPSTQGFGISFKEEFDSITKLFSKYIDIFFRRKKKKNDLTNEEGQ